MTALGQCRSGALLVVLLFLVVGCAERLDMTREPPAAPPDRWRIVATTGMVADLVHHIAGPRGEVVGLMGEGVDPHLFKPTVNDVKQLARADVIVYNGFSLEGRLEATLERLRLHGRRVVAVTGGLSESDRIDVGGTDSHSDPHVWMDVGLWRRCAEHVTRWFCEFDPAHRDEYLARGAAYAAQLAELDAYVRRMIGSIPERQRVLVTAHDAFHYFSRAYGIPVRSAQGISTESEPGVHDINALVDYLVERQIRAIFVETSVSESNLRAILEGARSRGWRVAIGGELFSDAMGPLGTYEGTYVGMMDHNATTIAAALGGDVPSGGWRGVLPIRSSAPLARRAPR